MSLFRLATLMAGVVVSAIVGSFAGQRTLAEPVEPQEAGNNPSQICYAETFSSSGDSSCPMGERETDETARARAYLIATASPGYTMTRQGPERAIGRLHPAFVHRLAAAIAEARAAGLSSTGIFSAYRPPAFGVGGFLDKFHSLHTYGLASTSPGSEPPARQALCCGTRSPPDMGDLPVRTAQPGRMESLPADAGKNHSVREPAARNRHGRRADRSRRYVRSRLFAYRGF